MKRFLMSVSLQHEPKASDVTTLVKKTFFRTSIVRNFISRGVKMRISAREACVKPHLQTRSDIKKLTWELSKVDKKYSFHMLFPSLNYDLQTSRYYGSFMIFRFGLSDLFNDGNLLKLSENLRIIIVENIGK